MESQEESLDEPPDPALIYQDFLDRSGHAVFQSHMFEFANYVSLPYRHISLDAKMLVETAEEMSAGWCGFADFLRARGVTDFIRKCTKAHFLSKDYLEGFHLAYLMHDKTPIIPAYPNRMVLRRVDDTWRMCECENAFYHLRWPISFLNVPDVAAMKLHSASDDVRRTGDDPLAVYQGFLNELSKANREKDFDAFCSKCLFPFSEHTLEDDVVHQGPADLRSFFDSFYFLMAQHNVDEISRTALHAQFVGPNTLCGYHHAHWLRDGEDVLKPIRSRMILERLDGEWFVESVSNSVSNMLSSTDWLANSGDVVTFYEIEERLR